MNAPDAKSVISDSRQQHGGAGICIGERVMGVLVV